MGDNGGGTFRNPNNSPTKICAACGRTFTWRKKWARDWEAVRSCSDRGARVKAGHLPRLRWY